MIESTFVLKSVFNILGVLLLVFLVACAISSLRQKFDILEKGWMIKYRIFIGAFFCLLVAFAIGIPNVPVETFDIGDYIETLQSPGGTFIQKASIEGFEEEVKNSPPGAQSEARTHFYAAEDDLAHQRYQEAAANYQRSLNIIETISAHMNMGAALRFMSEMEGAEDSWVMGLDGAGVKKVRVYEAGITSNIGEVLSTTGKTNLGLDSLEEALAMSRAMGYTKGEVACLVNIGNIYADLGFLGRALVYYETAIDIVVQERDRLTEAIILANMGGAYQDMGEALLALDHYLEAVRIFREVGDDRWKDIPIGELELVYTSEGSQIEGGSTSEKVSWTAEDDNLGTLLDYYNTTLELARETNDKTKEASSLGYMGSIYTVKEDHATGLSYLEEALLINQETGNRTQEAINLGNIGSLYFLKGELDTALSYFNKAFTINNEVFNEAGMAANLMNIGSVYALKGHTGTALIYYRDALDIAYLMGEDELSEQIKANIAQLEMLS
jgi:tetratricopeptide (TPR) repeat protein